MTTIGRGMIFEVVLNEEGKRYLIMGDPFSRQRTLLFDGDILEAMAKLAGVKLPPSGEIHQQLVLKYGKYKEPPDSHNLLGFFIKDALEGLLKGEKWTK